MEDLASMELRWLLGPPEEVGKQKCVGMREEEEVEDMLKLRRCEMCSRADVKYTDAEESTGRQDHSELHLELMS